MPLNLLDYRPQEQGREDEMEAKCVKQASYQTNRLPVPVM